jgi:hypothetical protein
MKKTMTKSILIVLALVVALVGILAFTACDEIEHGYLPEETLRFDIDTAKTQLDSVPSILLSTILDLALDKENSYIELAADGTFTCILTIDVEGLLANLGTLIGDLNIGEATAGITKSSLALTIDGYVKVMFPGFDLCHIEESLALLKNSLGVEIFGLDRSNAEVDKLFDCIEDPNNDRLIPADLDLNGLPSTIGIKIQGIYKMLDVFEEVTEGDEEARVWTFATVGAHSNDSMPYMNFSYSISKTGKQTIVWRNEVLGISVAGKIDAPND